MFSLKNKRAVVTGGGSGIGKAIATILARQGAEVHVIELGAEQAETTLTEIESLGGKAISYACDVADHDAVKQVFEKIGNIDILVNNAGIAHIGKADTTEESDFDRVMRVNV